MNLTSRLKIPRAYVKKQITASLIPLTCKHDAQADMWRCNHIIILNDILSFTGGKSRSFYSLSFTVFSVPCHWSMLSTVYLSALCLRSCRRTLPLSIRTLSLVFP